MLVQSTSGSVYAVLADTPDFEVAVAPSLKVYSTTVFLALRFRFKARTSNVLDPMLVPKKLLANGIDRSGDTLRTIRMFNTGFTVDKIGSGSPDIIAAKIQAACHGLVLPDRSNPEGCALTGKHLRSDFNEEFSKLVAGVITPIYPPKDFSSVSGLLDATDFQMAVEGVGEAKAPFSVVHPDHPDEDLKANVTKLSSVGALGDDDTN